jgi:selenocysteine-specific elongation factor
VHVIATAGHVDHGKSTLVRALTGMEPDRWAEERRRGMTIDLGFAWFQLRSGEQVAFVDVPGHERFTGNMLAGVGPVPAALLVVAADEGWRPQTEEHVRALDALQVRHGLLVVTKTDLAAADPIAEDAQRRLHTTTLRGVPWVGVSAVTGAGMTELVDAIGRLTASLPTPGPADRVRLWVDRAFSIRGAGTVVTGTLPSGSISVGDVLELRGQAVIVRGLQALGRPVASASGTARVALNLRGVPLNEVRRGDALTSPGRWRSTQLVDVWAGGGLPAHLVLHAGSASVAVGVRVLGGHDGGGVIARLRLRRPLPLQVGDRLLLRDPGGSGRVAGCVVLDPLPPALRRRGAAAQRAAALAAETGRPDAARELARRGAVRRSLLEAIGVDPGSAPASAVHAGDWLIGRPQWDTWLRSMEAAVTQSDGGAVLDAGVPAADVARSLGLPEMRLLDGLVAASELVEQRGGRLRRRGATAQLRPDLAAAVGRLRSMLEANPFAAPEQEQVAALGLTRQDLGAAGAAGAVLRLPGDVLLLPDAPRRAAGLLAALPAPFTLSEARHALGTTRRVAVPLLEHMDSLRLTERLGDGTRRLRAAAPSREPNAARTMVGHG